ncbi:MAG: hypothetical protein ACJAZO_003446 [Myxococcota bacterium]|jgi:hypothetical protein
MRSRTFAVGRIRGKPIGIIVGVPTDGADAIIINDTVAVVVDFITTNFGTTGPNLRIVAVAIDISVEVGEGACWPSTATAGRGVGVSIGVGIKEPSQISNTRVIGAAVTVVVC